MHMGRVLELAEATLRVESNTAELAQCHAVAIGPHPVASGCIRPGLAHSGVADVLASHQQAFPDVAVELRVEQSVPGLVEERYDLSDLSNAPHIVGTQIEIRACRVVLHVGRIERAKSDSPGAMNGRFECRAAQRTGAENQCGIHGQVTIRTCADHTEPPNA